MSACTETNKLLFHSDKWTGGISLKLITMKYLDFYLESLNKGTIPDNGLCRCFGLNNKHFNLLRPTMGDFSELRWNGKSRQYWGSGESVRPFSSRSMKEDHILQRSFTPLRQNIVLLMAAINGEL